MTLEELQAAHLEALKENAALKEQVKTHTTDKENWLAEKEKLLTANQKMFEESAAFYQGKNPFANSEETQTKNLDQLLTGITL